MWTSLPLVNLVPALSPAERLSQCADSFIPLMAGAELGREHRFMANSISRRQLLQGSAGLGGLILLGFSAVGASARSEPLTKLTMHRSAGCGCCLKWVAAAQAAGFDVSVVNSPDIVAFKQQHGVPEKLYSCHTTLAGRYVVEGHVPFDAVRKLLKDKPTIKGIAVPGMPMGAPGMEVPSGDKEAFEVMVFDSAGRISTFG